MNEFERALQSVAPSDSETSPMMIMFLAGQRSMTTSVALTDSRGATVWKLATGVLSAACLLLILGLVLVRTDANTIAKSITQPEIQHQLPLLDTEIKLDPPVVANHEIRNSIVELDLDSPKSLGLRVLQLPKYDSFPVQAQNPRQRGEYLDSTPATTPLGYRRESSEQLF